MNRNRMSRGVEFLALFLSAAMELQDLLRNLTGS